MVVQSVFHGFSIQEYSLGMCGHDAAWLAPGWARLAPGGARFAPG